VRALAFIFTLALAMAAPAHERLAKQDRLLLRPDGATLIIDYAVGGADARALRERMAAPEIERWLESQAVRFAALTVDGAALPLARVESRAELGEALAVHVVLTAKLALAPGRHRVRFADRHKDRRVAVPLALSAERLRIEGAPPRPLLDGAHPLDFIVISD
jgi:hypothetical protein